MNSIVLYQSPLDRVYNVLKTSPYILKQFVISNQLDKAYNVFKKEQYHSALGVPPTLRDFELMSKYGSRIVDMASSPGLLKEAEKVSKATHNRNTRLYAHIKAMLTLFPCLFLTLTFTDATLEKCSKDTLRKYVSLYLKSQSKYYVANIDYGKKNDRIHFHAVIVADSIDFTPWHKYGAINAEKIYVSIDKKQKVSNCVLENNSQRLGRYISKLTNHAIKETAERNQIIYSHDLKQLKVTAYYENLKATDMALQCGLELFGDSLEIRI
jgi:uncharacterized membrane protein